jgi:O-antigen/teichoic acid export membrane protein
LQLLMLVGIVRSASLIYSSLFRSGGKPSWRFGLYTVNAALNVLGFLTVVRLGIVAVAASYVVVSYLLMPLYMYMVRKLIHVSIPTLLKQYTPAVFGSLLMLLVVYGLRYFMPDYSSQLIRLLIFALAGGATYLIALRILQPSLYPKIWELAQMVLPKSLIRQS